MSNEVLYDLRQEKVLISKLMGQCEDIYKIFNDTSKGRVVGVTLENLEWQILKNTLKYYIKFLGNRILERECYDNIEWICLGSDRVDTISKELIDSIVVQLKKIELYVEEEEYKQNICKKEEKRLEIILKKEPKIFISHSVKDKKYVEIIVELFEDIGVKKEQLFCSSIPGYGIPLGEDIYSHLKKEFLERELFVIFILSRDYYDSTPCQNEMGAAWILQNDYRSILLPNFEFCEIKGAINPNKIGIKLNDESIEYSLIELRNQLIEKFKLPIIDEQKWLRNSKKFIESVGKIKP